MKNKKQKIIIFDLDDTLFDSTNQPKDMGHTWDLKLFEGFLPVLESNDYRHILVTRGNVPLQNRKIDVLGIRKYFSNIYIVESDELKHEQFKTIKNTFPNEEIIVIGNRIDCEIRYGNLLGLKTIYFKHGKYADLVPKDQYELATHTFLEKELNRIKDVI